VRTALTELLGIEAPIVLAPMGGAVTAELAVAVSNAGGLGVVPLSWGSPDEIRGAVAEMTALTDRPFGVNLILEWDQRDRLTAALDAGAPVISFFWGDYTGLFDGGWPDAPHRVLRNSTVEAWEEAGRPAPGERPGEEDDIAARADGSPIKRYASATPHASMTGEIEALPNWAGQGVGLVTRIQPAAEIVRELVAGAERILAKSA
jgi:NAD(P)H-dependent flavin oxidoreductase YrpB (nitropropane dioxygenase family)